MYTLYVEKEKLELKVTKAKKIHQNWNYTEQVTRFNDCYYLCLKRKPLVEKAKKIQQDWIDELETNLAHVKNIEI